MYLGKGDFKVAPVFTSLLDLCFAGIVAVLLNSWSQRSGRVRSKSSRPVTVGLPADSPTSPAANTATEANSTVTIMPPAQPSPQVAELAKQKPPKKVYYNIAGEPVESDDE
jgi:hypothetical protein